MRRALLLAMATFTVASCGSSGASEDYSAFCTVADELEVAAGDTHLDDPAAISDVKVMEESWTKTVTSAEKLRDASPSKIKDDVTLMVSTLIDMNKIFKANNYDLMAMAKNEDIRKELDAISTRDGVEDASARFNDFMKDNCAK